MKITIDFSDEDVEKALANYFKIKVKDIIFWHIRSIMRNGHTLTYNNSGKGK